MSPDKPVFTNADIDRYLWKLAKQYRKINGKRAPAVEIILVGGAAAVLNYDFRQSTRDMDARIQAGASMKEAINAVGEECGLPDGWMNSDFTRTASYTPKIRLYAQHYRTFGPLEVYTVTGRFLLAMKLKAYRPYKYDRSDVIGILWACEKRGEPLTLEQIQDAVVKLYGSYDALSDEARTFLEQALVNGDYEARYQQVKQLEAESKDILLQFQESYPGAMNRDNVNDILASIREKRRKEE